MCKECRVDGSSIMLSGISFFIYWYEACKCTGVDTFIIFVESIDAGFFTINLLTSLLSPSNRNPSRYCSTKQDKKRWPQYRVYLKPVPHQLSPLLCPLLSNKVQPLSNPSFSIFISTQLNLHPARSLPSLYVRISSRSFQPDFAASSDNVDSCSYTLRHRWSRRRHFVSHASRPTMELPFSISCAVSRRPVEVYQDTIWMFS